MFIQELSPEVQGFKDWLRVNRQLSETSEKNYLIIVNKFLSENPDLEDIDSYNQFLHTHIIKKRSSYALYAIKLFIMYLFPKKTQQDQFLERLIPVKQFKNIKKVRKFVEDKQVHSLINALSETKHRVIAIIQFLTGVRAGDILRLSADDGLQESIHNGKKVLRLNIIGKGEKQNWVFIHNEDAIDLIMNYILSNCGHPDYFFLEMPERRLSEKVNYTDISNLLRYNYYKYWSDFKKAMDIAGIERDKFATHDLRRGFARKVWDKYKDVQILQKILNHENPATTMRYLRSSGLENIDIFKDLQENN
jgi:integrase